MFFWFIGTAVLSIWYVFRDPAFDYRFLIFGALAPDVIDGIWGGARGFHSVTVSVVALIAVMVFTIGRRARRKMLLGIPIGFFLHLVYDGAFTNTAVFWWPFTGLSFDGSRLPVVERGLMNIIFEVIGLGLCIFIWRHFTLNESASRRQFIASGRLGS